MGLWAFHELLCGIEMRYTSTSHALKQQQLNRMCVQTVVLSGQNQTNLLIPSAGNATVLESNTDQLSYYGTYKCDVWVVQSDKAGDFRTLGDYVEVFKLAETAGPATKAIPSF